MCIVHHELDCLKLNNSPNTLQEKLGVLSLCCVIAALAIFTVITAVENPRPIDCLDNSAIAMIVTVITRLTCIEHSQVQFVNQGAPELALTHALQPAFPPNCPERLRQPPYSPAEP